MNTELEELIARKRPRLSDKVITYLRSNEVAAKVKIFADKNGLSDAGITRGINVSPSQISSYFGGTYKGNVAGLEKKLKAYMKTYNPSKPVKKTDIFRTVNMIMAHDTLRHTQSARKTCIIYGVPGSGKTVMIKEFEKLHPEAIVIYTSVNISTKNVLESICKKVGVQNGTPYMMEKNLSAHFNLAKESNNIIIIDEAENMKTSTLETLRAIRDASNVPMAFVGTHALLGNLQSRGGSLLQLTSRIVRKYEFGTLEDEEWIEIFGRVAPYIRSLTNNFRVAKNTIYDTALTFANSEDEELDIKHIQAILPMVMIPS